MLPGLLAAVIASALMLVLPPATEAQPPAANIDATPLHEPDEHLVEIFPRQANIEVSAPGLSHLILPTDVLRAARPDLTDLRIFDAEGREVPYLVDDASRLRHPTTPDESVSMRVIDADRRTSEGGQPFANYYESYTLEASPEWSDGQWQLAIATSSMSFLRRARIIQVDGEGRPIGITVEGSFFRLPDAGHEQLTIELPQLITYGDAGIRLRVELEGETAYINPTFALRARRDDQTPQTAMIPLEVLDTVRLDDRSRIELSRPRGLRPTALAFRTTTTAFDRQVKVLDVGPPITSREAGNGVIIRAPGVERASVRIGTTAGDRLIVEIMDGDSPPLQDLRIEASLEQPALLFESKGPGAVLRFGGGRARAPHYDLARLLEVPLIDRIGASLDAQEASLDDVVDNPAFDSAPALAFAMRPGTRIERRRFTHAAALAITSAPEGLSRLRLPPELLAHGSQDVRDLRVVDGDDRQWPVLVERGLTGQVMPVAIGAAAPAEEGSRSLYAIGLGADQIALEALALETNASFVNRRYELRGHLVGDESPDLVVLQSGELQRDPNHRGPLLIRTDGRWIDALELVVHDGDDQPLQFNQARATTTAIDLYLVAPVGTYTVLIGDPEAQMPHYEILAARDLLLSVTAIPVALGAVTNNRAYRPETPTFFERLEDGAIWAVLGIAVLVLLLLTYRVARTGEAPDADAGGGGSSSSPPSQGSSAVEGPAQAKADADGDSDPPPDVGQASVVQNVGGDQRKDDAGV